MHVNLIFFTDAAKSDKLGFGGVFGRYWMKGSWWNFVKDFDPSIEYLELYALVVTVDLWAKHFANKRVLIFCDNEAVVHMVNQTSARCENSMVLIRLLVLTSIKFNCRIFVHQVPGIQNILADPLSRNKMTKFWQEASKLNMKRKPSPLPDKMWPPHKIWR